MQHAYVTKRGRFEGFSPCTAITAEGRQMFATLEEALRRLDPEEHARYVKERSRVYGGCRGDVHKCAWCTGTFWGEPYAGEYCAHGCAQSAAERELAARPVDTKPVAYSQTTFREPQTARKP